MCTGDLTQDLSAELAGGHGALAAVGAEAQQLSQQFSQVVARVRSAHG